MTIETINQLPDEAVVAAFTKCCGAQKWVRQMVEARPFRDREHLFAASDEAWANCGRADFLEAFSHHPKIGDMKSLEQKFASTKSWSASEQGSVQAASRATLEALAAGNRHYEERFGFIFIVCATGKSAAAMLAILQARLTNDPETELQTAACEQHKITRLRLEKLLMK